MHLAPVETYKGHYIFRHGDMFVYCSKEDFENDTAISNQYDDLETIKTEIDRKEQTPMNIDYSKMTNEEFNNCLKMVLSDMSALDLIVTVPDIYSEVAEYFNNDVLDQWKENKLADVEFIDLGYGEFNNLKEQLTAGKWTIIRDDNAAEVGAPCWLATRSERQFAQLSHEDNGGTVSECFETTIG